MFEDPLAIDIADTFKELKKETGFTYFAIANVESTGATRRNDYVASSITDFPRDWVSYYDSRNLAQYDPVVAFAQHTTQATPWDRLDRTNVMTKAQSQVMHAARDHGLKSGVFLSARQFSGGLQLISFASDEDRYFSSKELDSATNAGLKMAIQLASTHGSPSTTRMNPLSDRERECLTWAAIGKSSTDIETIIGISRNTVDFHIKNAMAKLDATSRTFAIVKAIRLGLIDP